MRSFYHKQYGRRSQALQMSFVPTKHFKDELQEHAQRENKTLYAYLFADLKHSLGYVHTAEREAGKKLIVCIYPTQDPFVFHVLLLDNTIVVAEKTSRWSSDWRLTYKGQTMPSNHAKVLHSMLVEKFATPYTEIVARLQRHAADPYYMMSDDFRVWSAGSDNEEKIVKLFKRLTDAEKAQVLQMEEAKYFTLRFK